ncbi:MAG: shikimate dehydrogenase [Nitrospirae bacterium]|nr:shikimate dehydrogenase [Nitrospirota bacterium]
MALSAQTQLCGVLGNPVKHSLSPAIHNAAFQELHLDFVYLAFQVEHIQPAIEGIRALGNIRGCSVTIPHKVSALPFLDDIDPTAKQIGAINTIVKHEGRLRGINTDATGALRALREAGINPQDERITLIGSGGAARAIAFGLAMDSNIRNVSLLGIDERELHLLANDLRERTGITVSANTLDTASLQPTLEDSSLLIHCTPIGMSPKTEETCIPPELLHPGLTVMDIVYNPLETRLLREAKNKGARTIPGIEMFLYQAVIQFELWTDRPAPVSLMRTVLESQFS